MLLLPRYPSASPCAALLVLRPRLARCLLSPGLQYTVRCDDRTAFAVVMLSPFRGLTSGDQQRLGVSRRLKGMAVRKKRVTFGVAQGSPAGSSWERKKSRP